MSIRDLLPRAKNNNAIDGASALTPEHRERAKLFALYWDYYRGRHRKHLRVKAGQADDNVVINYSKRVVNKGVHFLFGKPVRFEIDGTDDETPEETFLEAVWGGDETRGAWLQNLALNGAVCGTAFVRLYPAETRDGLPRLVNLDPATVDVVTLDDDVEDVRGYRIVWRSGRGWRRQRIDRMEGGWSIVDERTEDGVRWEMLDEAVWPWEFAPVVHCQNLPSPNQVWGISDLEEADINDAINFVASNINRILRFHAHPKTIGTGFDAATLQNTAVEQFWTIPNDQAKVFNLEMQSDLQSSMAYMAFLRNMYSKITGVPELDPDQVNVGALSGFALRILYGDLLEKTATKRNLYGGLLSELNRRILVTAGLRDMIVRNVWQSPLPEDIQAEAEALKLDREVGGLSQQTYLERRGYDWRREQQRIQEEKLTDAAQQDTIGGFLLRQFDRAQA